MHYRVMWNYGGTWQDCEHKIFRSLERAIDAALKCEKQGGAPHRVWVIADEMKIPRRAKP